MFRGLICIAIIATSVLLLVVAKQVKQAKKQRVIPDQFKIEVGEIPRWLYRHAYNVSINGRLKTDRCRVPMELSFNKSMLPADLYEQVYLHKFIMPPVPKEKPLDIDPLNMTFDERRKYEMDEFFGTERPYAWIQRGWNYTCEVCQKQFPVESDYILHEAMHYVTNYSATPVMNWTIIQMQDEKYRNESQSYWIDYWWKVSKGLIDPEWDTDFVPTTWSYRENPIICYICNASIYNTSDYNPHILRHKEWEEEKFGNLTAKFSRPTKSFDEIHFRKLYVPDSLNTLEEAEYEEAQRIVKEASHSLNTDELMERTKNLSINKNKRLLEFGVDSRGFTITWPRLKLMPEMEPQNDSQSIARPWTDFPDSELNRFQEERRRKWEEDYLRRRKAQEKGNPDFATYSLESNETAMERRALNITRRRRKYTPKLIYIRRKRRDVTTGVAFSKKTKKTTPYPQRLLGKKILRRVNSNKRKTKDQVYKQQLAKIIQRAKKYMLKYNKTNYPTTQSNYEKVQIYKIKEKFKKLNWFLHGLDNYTVPPEIDIDMITNTPHSTVRPLFYKRLEKRDLWMRQFIDYKRHKRHIDELKGLIDNVDKIHQEIMAEDNDGRVKSQRKKRFVNFEDINLQEIENVLNPLPPGTIGENPLKEKQAAYERKLLKNQQSNYKKLLFKRDVERSKLLKNNLEDAELKRLIKRDLSAKTVKSRTGNTTDSLEFFDSSEDEQEIKRHKRELHNIKLTHRENVKKDMEIIVQTFNLLLEANKHHRSKRLVDDKKIQECEFFKNLLDENKALDEDEREMIQLTKQAIKRSAENEAKNKTVNDVKNRKESPETVQHFNMDQNHINQFNKIRNKRSPHNHVHEHDEDRCELLKLKREKREPRFRKDRLPTKKKKRTTCPYFARTKYMYNCTACDQVFSLEGILANHEWRKHNGSALIVSYDTKDIEDEYYSWDYEAIPANDTVETTREKWEKRCLVPNQKRHRYMNKGCTARYRPDQDGGGGGDDHQFKKKRDVDAVQRSIHKRSICGVQKPKVKHISSGQIDNVHKMLKRDVRIEDSEGNPVTKFAPEVEAVIKGNYDKMFKGKSIELGRTEDVADMSGNANGTRHFINETLMNYIETLDTNETLNAAIEAKNHGYRKKRDVNFHDLTDELHSNVRDHDRKYIWEWDKSWEWRIKNVNIRDYMYRIMEKRMTPSTPPPDCVIYDMFDASHDKIKYPSHESRNRRVSQFYADNGYFSGRTGSDMEIYMDSNPHLPELKEVGPPNHDYGKDYIYKPKPQLFAKRYHQYTNVKPGSRTKLPKGHTTEINEGFTDKKDYYDSDIEVAKSQFRFRRDLNDAADEGQYSMIRSEDSVAKTVHRRRRGITYDSDYSSNIKQFSVEDTQPEIFSKLYPNVAEYTPYTFYPPTQPWLTMDPKLDPAATYKWIEKSGPDSGDDDFETTKSPLEESVQQFLESEMMSHEMAKETIHPQDYQDWLDWQRNRSLEDENSYHPRVWTCQFHPCTFNASVEADVGDHIFMHHFTYPTNYKEAIDYHVETTTLGYERLTDVDFILNRYSDEALHPEIREDFDIFTGLYDKAGFPTVHPNYTRPSKPKRTPYVPTTDPMCETIGSTKAPRKHAHTLDGKVHHKAHSLVHGKTSHAAHEKHHQTTPHHTGHRRVKRGRDSDPLPPMPPDSNERSEDRDRGSDRSRRRYKRAYHSKGPISAPNSKDDLSGYDGPAFMKSGESLGDITPKQVGTTVWDWSSWQSEYEPQNQTQWKFSEETVPPKYRCKYCGELFHEEEHLLTHRSSAHPRKKPRTTTPSMRHMRKFFTLDSEVDMSKNYDFVFSEPDNGSFIQHRPILEDSFYQSFDSKHPDNLVNSASYREMDEYVDYVFNKSKYSICNACGKNISDFSAEAHFRKHVSNIKKDYFDELPPEYMDRCFKEAHWNESWETIHHKLKRQYEENRIVQSIFEPETYKCNRCNTTFKTHELTYAHLLEHKKNSSLISAREAAIRTQLKRERAKHATTLRKEQKDWNPEYIDYLKKAGREKRAIDCIEIEYPNQSNSNHSVPLYKIYESFNNSKERIENITPESLSNMPTVEKDKRISYQNVINHNDSETKIKDDYNERSVSENLESRIQDRYCKETSDLKVNVTTNDDNSKRDHVKEESDGPTVDDIPDYYFNVNYKADDNDEQDNNSEENEDSSYDSDSNTDSSNGKKEINKHPNSRVKKPTLEEFIAKVRKTFKSLTSKDILSTNLTLLRRIENIFEKTGNRRKAFLSRLRRAIDDIPKVNIADRWNSTECNIVEKLEKKFSTKMKDRGHKLLETDVSRLADEMGLGHDPRYTSLENKQRLRSFRECMKIIDLHETRSEQDYHVIHDSHLEYMRPRKDSTTLSPSDESLIRSKPRNEYSDYEELMSDRWKCYECNKTFENYTAFLMHMKKEKDPKWPFLIDMENEKEKASIEKLFTTKSYWVNECYECGKKFNSRQELLDHINDKGYESLPHVQKIDQSVKCIHCDIVYTNVQKYLEHRADIAEAERLLKNITEKEFCGDCKKYFDTPEDYLHHLNMERKVDYEEMKKYVCKTCNFTYLDSISLAVHVKKIHPEMLKKDRRRKRRSCQIGNRQKVKIVPRHANYEALRHIMLKSLNENRRKRRNADYEMKFREAKMMSRRKRDLKELLNIGKRNEEYKKSIHKCDCHANVHGGIKKREINTINKNQLVNKHVPANKVKDIINKRKRRGVEELMDKMDKEYEKYIVYNYNPEFNLKHPILMHEQYRHHYLQGILEEEKYLQLQGREERQRLLGSRQIGQELVPPGQDLEEDVKFAHGPAIFGTTWSYNLWPTIRYNILAPGKSYNNTQYFHRYYQNQTVKNRIKDIFRDFFAKPFNASVPVMKFVEPERDTEELESLAMKERRKRSLEILEKDVENKLYDIRGVVHQIDNHQIRNKRHYIDKACFHERRERPNIGKKIERKCNCKDKENKVPIYQQQTDNHKEYLPNTDQIIFEDKIKVNGSILNENVSNNIGAIELKKIRQRTAKPTSPKPPRTQYRRENDGVENVLLDVAAMHADQQAHPLTAQCGCHRKAAARNRRQIRVDVMNNNTIQKINWERLAKILVAENRNLSNLLDKHMTKRTTPIRKYECKTCGDRFLSLQPYVEHVVRHEKEFELEKSYSEEFNITCDHCYQIFSTEDAIHEHNLERMRLLKEREAEDYALLNRTTRRKIFTPFEDPFTIPIMENEDNTWWNPDPITVTDDPAEDRYYCYYCKDLMSNTKEFVEHRKFHEVSRMEAKKAYLERKKKLDEKIRKEFSIEGEGEIHM